MACPLPCHIIAVLERLSCRRKAHVLKPQGDLITMKTTFARAGITTLAALGLAFAGTAAHAQTVIVAGWNFDNVTSGASSVGRSLLPKPTPHLTRPTAGLLPHRNTHKAHNFLVALSAIAISAYPSIGSQLHKVWAIFKCNTQPTARPGQMMVQSSVPLQALTITLWGLREQGGMISIH